MMTDYTAATAAVNRPGITWEEVEVANAAKWAVFDDMIETPAADRAALAAKVAAAVAEIEEDNGEQAARMLRSVLRDLGAGDEKGSDDD